MALMALREGLPSNMLYADGASTIRNFVVVMAWHGGFPRVSTSCTDPKDSTLSPENSLKWAFIGLSFSLPMPIFPNVDANDVNRAFVVDQDLVDCFIGHDDPYH